MFKREFWLKRLEQAWRERTVVWLTGVRRSGKTCLSRSLPDVEYFDCELPRIRKMMENAEAFLAGLNSRRIVLDEVHRLPNPSELLKIATDQYPKVKILVTGSSTLAISAKLYDTLVGRKRDVQLTPMTLADLHDFQNPDLAHRFLHGGLPPFFLSRKVPEPDFPDWIDTYWAKDVQELFRIERRSSFQRFLELLLANSGGIFEATRFSRPCEVSRPTIANYLAVLKATHVAHVLRPFSTFRPTEITSAPKVYGFDTGFVCYFRDWHSLRPDDLGLLWEHFVLNELQASQPGSLIQYWRDKSGHEIDFVLTRPGGHPLAIECKWSAGAFEARNLRAFRHQYPQGENFVVASDVEESYTHKMGPVSVVFENLAGLTKRLLSPSGNNSGISSRY